MPGIGNEKEIRLRGISNEEIWYITFKREHLKSKIWLKVAYDAQNDKWVLMNFFAICSQEEEEDRLRRETVENAQIAYQSIFGKSFHTE